MWNELDPYWGDNDGVLERDDFVAFFSARGVSNYIIYGFSSTDVQHAALPLGGTCAERKLGQYISIRHDASEMEGGVTYGDILP